MKRFTTTITVFALVCTFVMGAYAGPTNPEKPEANKAEEAQWALFSKNLVRALKSENEGVRLGALQMIIHYGDQLDVDGAVIDVMRLYRNHSDDDVRRMAVVALGHMHNDGAIGYLRLSKDYEKSETVRRTIKDVIAEYEAARQGAVAKIGA